MRPGFIAVVLVGAAAVTSASCGGADKRASESAEESVAAEIRASAEHHQHERDRQERARAEARSTTTALSATDSLPARSAQIDRRPTSSSGTWDGLLSAADRASFARLAQQLPGQEGIAVSTLGIGRPVNNAGTLSGGVAWSTTKVPLAMAAINARVGTQADLAQAITASDNAAAERLWTALGDGAPAAAAVTEQVRVAGDHKTVIEARRLRAGLSAFGQTAWPLTDQVRFVAGMTCSSAGAHVLGLMNKVIAEQRWGLAATRGEAQTKSGWGPGVTSGDADGWLDRQMGVITIRGKPIAVAIATTASNHTSGTQTLTAIAGACQAG